MDEIPIHLFVPRAAKSRWVWASRAAGMKLSDWLSQAAEAHMQQQLARVAIPDNVDFSDLRLARDSDGHVSFDWPTIERVCVASRMPVEVLRNGPEDNVAALIVAWYQAHLKNGGARDAVADDLISEAMAEDDAGQSFSHAPGRG
ncbi:hypothetical protein DK842_17960 [Chromobacterium phragmitis]|uniref:hypothetical protein n=1 Tax=Chromobacterium phragmitis TaxID=2202141 RepID=UPI000DEC9156|nr:hypothetical protein [Chromobacterium phragmitis]AXE32749.1 hypothetical protein DK842_17960 [Chromobacterium phragmitis]